MLPAIETAEKILEGALACNPGPWGKHSRLVAELRRSGEGVSDPLLLQ